MKKSEEFVDIYNEVDNWLTRTGKYDKYVSYSKKIKNLSPKDTRIRLFREDLLSYGELRNAIVHNSLKRNEIIAEPHERVVTRYKYILEELKHPEKVYPKFKEDISMLSPSSFINALLLQMKKSSFIQVPIFDRGAIIDIVNCQTVVRWLADEIHPSGSLDVEQTKISALLPFVQYKRNFKYIQKGASIYEAYEDFVEHKKEAKVHLDALYITERGDESKILGLITLDEIVGALGIREL